MSPPPKRQRISGPLHARDQLDREASIREGPLRFAKDDILKEPKLEIRDGRLTHGRRRGHTIGEGQPLLQRRQNAATDLTVVVTTVAVAVDVNSAGDPTTTVTLPQVPSVPAFPSDLTVPSVPAVPTPESVTLPTVPTVPQTGTELSTVAEATAGTTNSQQVLASPPATPALTSPLASATGIANSANSTVVTPSSISTAPLNALNSTSSTASSSLSSLIASNSSTILTSSSIISSSSTSSSSFTDSSTETFSSSSATVAIGPGATGAAGGAGGQSGTGSSSSGGNSNSSSGNTPGPVIAGAVTGSVGAAAILLILAWLFLRWYRRRATHPARLTGDDSATSLRPGTDSTPNMSQRHTLLPAGFISRMNRFSRDNRGSSPALPESERGFQKISGRKLESQFDDKYEGPMSRDFEAERQRQQHQSMISETSAYRSSYGSTGEGPSTYDPTAKETLMPSPARTPVVHSGVYSQDFAHPPGTSRSTLSPPQTPHTAQTVDSVGRSHRDGSRGSRFTEEV